MTELAICTPVMLVIALGIIECCNMIQVKTVITSAAAEGARRAVGLRVTAADVTSLCAAFLAEARVQQGTVSVEPAVVSAVPVGDYVTVTVSAPADANSFIPNSFFRGRTLVSQVTMMKEY